MLMVEVSHPEVLARDWLPPVVLGREREVAEVVRRLDPPHPRSPPPWIVGLVGPAGSGASVVARRAAREVADRLRAEGAGAIPRVVGVRTAGLRGTHGVASALLRHLDEGFDGRGFAVAEILAGFLRRLRREGRPTVLVLDDVGIGGPDLTPLLRAVAEPDRFLPEGEFGMPPIWTIVAGTPEGWATLSAGAGDHLRFGPAVALAPYPLRVLTGMVRDRAERALGHPPVPGLVDRTVERAVAEGGGARRALDLLRRELLGVAAGPRAGEPFRGYRPTLVEVETRVVRAIEAVSHNRAARLGDLRRCEAELARAQGARPLPATTLWRRIVRLERAGYVRREIRPGGTGGTQSVVRVLTPVEEWVTSTRRPEIHPAGGSWTEFPRVGGEPSLSTGELTGVLRPPSDPID
jgi:hypothetical protein